MDFGILYQLRSKQFWWIDAVLYFVIALLVAAVVCFFVFSIRISSLKADLVSYNEKIAALGTSDQKDIEKNVFTYQSKLNNFAMLLSAHNISSNAFKIFEEETLATVWFSSYLIDVSSAQIQLAGEADNLSTLSHQIANFEDNENVVSVSDLNTSLSTSGNILFRVTMMVDKDIFSITTLPSPLDTTSGSGFENPLITLSGSLNGLQ